ncbi:hypothetical protein BJX99DRAFT_252899 [Aspergillus californicus]
MRPKSRDDFRIAIICALPLEAEAVEALFDEHYDRLGEYYGRQPGDTNIYINGRIGKHDVVLCCYDYMRKRGGASGLQLRYVGIELVLLVGICGGAPPPPEYQELFLGDVIISASVIECDFGRQYPSGSHRKTIRDTPGRPSREAQVLLNGLRAETARSELQNQTQQYLHMLQQTGPKWGRPRVNDILFEASYLHKHSSHASPPGCTCFRSDLLDEICGEALRKDCDDLGCDKGQAIRYREVSEAIQTSIYIGTVASTDVVIKSGQNRDAIARHQGVIGFEIESPGVWEGAPCIFIKGVCDYADSHRNKSWQAYAAATGASAAKAFLEYWQSGSGVKKGLQEGPFNDSNDEENGEEQEQWDSVLRSRRMYGECLNCGYLNHSEKKCYLKCGRCQKNDHGQRNCPNRIRPAGGHYKANRDADLEECIDKPQEINFTKASAEVTKVAKDNPEQHHDEHSVESPPPSTIFDESGRTRQTLSSTGTTFHGPTLPSLDIPLTSKAGIECSNSNEDFGHNSEFEQHCGREDFDTETTCSVDSIPDDQKFCYMRAFATQLNNDLICDSERSAISNIDYSYLSSVLKAFAWKLHGESSNPFQWEASATLRQKQNEIMNLLVSGEDQAEKEEDESPRSSSFKKPQDLVSDWINNVEHNSPFEEGSDLNENYPEDSKDPFLSELPNYEKFIRESDAYQWLLLKLRQHGQLPLSEFTSVSEIGTMVWKSLRVQKPLHRISRRRGSLVAMEFQLDWTPMSYLNDIAFASSDSFPERVLCLTGTQSEAQATTVIEYLRQTWPVSGEHTIRIIRQLISLPRGQNLIYQLPGPNAAKIRAHIHPSSQCFISVTGSLYLVAEIAEQIAWLTSALQASPNSQGVVTCYPRMENLDVRAEDKRASDIVVVGSCQMVFDFEDKSKRSNSAGFCWGPLFSNITLIGEYPIPLRPFVNTGLEISLSTMAYLARSQQVVQWGERIMIKGFNSLLVATSATDSITVWHLFLNKCPDKRISYIDWRLETLESTMTEKHSLRFLERTRHIVGWCSNITDFCGHSMAPKAISGCGLPKPPATVVIDRLYIEAGSEAVAGLSISLNKKNQPFWLERENDYPSLLKWISNQAIIFYDVSEHRAWLVDGASALLHLLRTSLYLDENDPESTYNWIFNMREMKDTWDDCAGRLAALKTLKHPENLRLKLYVKNPGSPVEQFMTIRERVSKLMHSFEILVDLQAKASSQDGIRISQTLNFHKGIPGFDILDIVSPLGPIHTRIKHLSSLGPGWIDLIPSLEATTIFGNGFGDLIQPNDPSAVCGGWKSIPTDKEYMTASVSTIKMLYQKRLHRSEPGLGLGELTSKIMWSAECNPFKSCGCLQARSVGTDCHLNPVQYLLPRSSWRSSIIPKRLAPIDLEKLEEKGAVVFGHLSFLGKPQEENKDKEAGKQPSSRYERSSSQGNTGTSTTVSVESQLTRSTGITQPSLESSIGKDTGMKKSSNSKKEDKRHMKASVVSRLLAKIPGFKDPGAGN